MNKRKNDSEKIENGGKERKNNKKKFLKQKQKLFSFIHSKGCLFLILFFSSINLYLIFQPFPFLILFLFFSSSFFPALFGTSFFLSLSFCFFLSTPLSFKTCSHSQREIGQTRGRIKDFLGGGGRRRLCARTNITSAKPNSLSAGVQGLRSLEALRLF